MFTHAMQIQENCHVKTITTADEKIAPFDYQREIKILCIVLLQKKRLFLYCTNKEKSYKNKQRYFQKINEKNMSRIHEFMHVVYYDIE